MNIRETLVLGILIFGASTFSSLEVWAQADPYWLKSWIKAQESRPATIRPSGRIAAEGEPGVPMIIHGRVWMPDGSPAPGVIVHAYHRDHAGLDFGPNDNTLSTWRLQGWAKTDAGGRFEFQTIRPAPDHLGREGAHVHITLESAELGRQWAPTLFFADDPRVTAAQRSKSEKAGEFGAVRPVRTIDGIQHVDVNIELKEESDF